MTTVAADIENFDRENINKFKALNPNAEGDDYEILRDIYNNRADLLEKRRKMKNDLAIQLRFTPKQLSNIKDAENYDKSFLPKTAKFAAGFVGYNKKYPKYTDALRDIYKKSPNDETGLDIKEQFNVIKSVLKEVAPKALASGAIMGLAGSASKVPQALRALPVISKSAKLSSALAKPLVNNATAIMARAGTIGTGSYVKNRTLDRANHEDALKDAIDSAKFSVILDTALLGGGTLAKNIFNKNNIVKLGSKLTGIKKDLYKAAIDDPSVLKMNATKEGLKTAQAEAGQRVIRGLNTAKSTFGKEINAAAEQFNRLFPIYADDFSKQVASAAGFGAGIAAVKNPLIAALSLPFSPIVHKVAIKTGRPLVGLGKKLLNSELKNRGLALNSIISQRKTK
ncbi:hypothetical protein NO2_0405 [Candidatus Termititenax persephonae]|uniref:Uncharacterized protein n=1 Tax=Candidatus Termititenax persephonae TaxID=2218525 RepID=A0A388TG85_9BACT|nr:hypothetical protein NO2_0405 [Candidatus Termititenax persephonae]